MRKHNINYDDLIGLNALNNREAETNLLSVVIQQPSVLNSLESLISDSCFYDDTNKTIWQAIRSVNNSGIEINIVSIFQEVLKSNKGIQSFQIASLTQNNIYPSVKVISELSHVVMEFDIKRKLQNMAIQTLSKLYTNEDIQDVTNGADEAINSIISGSVSNSSTQKLNKIIEKCEIELEQRIINKGAGGINSGITGLDKMLGGFKPSELIIIGARPAMGKTATLLKFLTTASSQNKKSAIFSLEMSAIRLVDRIIIAKSGVSAYKYRNGFLDKDEKVQVLKANDELALLPMWIDDKANQRIDYIRNVSRKLKKNEGLDIIAIDYLQLIDQPENGKGNREREVSEISRGLKLLAKELEIPVILLCQLNRDVEKTADKRPMLSHLRESGSIEQDADVVIFIHRMFPYTQIDEDKNEITYITAKQRDGAIGDVRCWCNDSLTQIYDIEDGSPEYFQGKTNVPF